MISEDFAEENPETVAEFKIKAREISAEVIFVSIQTDEGRSFKNIGGVGAFLRFAVH